MDPFVLLSVDRRIHSSYNHCMTKLILLPVALLAGCTVTINNNYGALPQAYVQPQPVVYNEAQVRQPHSIKAVQNRRLSQEEARAQAAPLQPLQPTIVAPDSVDYANRERIRLTPGQFSAKEVDGRIQ